MRSSANTRVMAALGAAGFPVPRVHGLCEDESVIGTPFFVMDMVEGRIVWEAHFPGLSPAERAAHFDAMNATIAQLHSYRSRRRSASAIMAAPSRLRRAPGGALVEAI